MAPDLRGRINMARMAAAEMAHYELLRSTLESRGVDVLPRHHPVRARAGAVPPADHAQHLAGSAGEDLRGRRDGRGFVSRDRRFAAPGDRRRGARAAGRDGALAVRGGRGGIGGDGQRAAAQRGWRCGRGGCWGAITQAQYVLADHDELVDRCWPAAASVRSPTFSTGCSARTTNGCGGCGWPDPSGSSAVAGGADRVVGLRHHGLCRRR